jgi:hypothetical protein
MYCTKRVRFAEGDVSLSRTLILLPQHRQQRYIDINDNNVSYQSGSVDRIRTSAGSAELAEAEGAMGKKGRLTGQ